MIPANGWIKLHRQITEWQHWSNPNVLATFIHLLTMANYEDRAWNGVIVQRGQLVTSQRTLAEEIGITRVTLRRVLSLLQETGEIEMQVVTVGDRKNCTLITVPNYNEYQGDSSTSQSESGWPTKYTTDSENRGPRGIPRKDPMNTSILEQKTNEGGPRSRDAKPEGVAHTKEYIRSNKNNISTTTTAHARERNENENEKKLDEGHSQVNAEEQGEKKEKNCAKKERKELGDYSGLKNSNMRIVADLKANEVWLSDTATICKVSKAEVLKKLDEFELDNTTRYKQLSLPDAFNHFQRWLRLSTDIDSRRSRARPRATRKPTNQADKDPNAAWKNPQIQAMLQRNREESARQLREFRERQQLLQAQKQ